MKIIKDSIVLKKKKENPTSSTHTSKNEINL